MENNDIQKLRRARQLALAMIRRGKDAKIPANYLRIGEESFSNLLSPEFYGGKDEAKKFAELIYSDPSSLLRRKFISIDGGNVAIRQKAGYALLFRTIAYDKMGMYWNCGELVHKFQNINANKEISRNDLADQLKEYDVLFLGEFDRTNFRPHFESKEFFDEVLEHRVNFNKLTIVSCVSPIQDKTASENALEGKNVSDCGRYLQRLSIVYKTTENILRVRVKGTEEANNGGM